MLFEILRGRAEEGGGRVVPPTDKGMKIIMLLTNAWKREKGEEKKRRKKQIREKYRKTPKRNSRGKFIQITH